MTAPISFTGLASGIDTNQIISQLLSIQQKPVDAIKDKNEILAVQRQAYQDVNTQLLSLQTQTLPLRLESTFTSRSAVSSDESKLTVSAGYGAAKTSHRVEITQLAQEAIVNSQRYLSQAQLLGTNTVGINILGGTTRANAPGAGRIKGAVALSETTTLGDLGLSDFTLKVDPDGTGKHAAVSITGLSASTTVSDLMTKIRNQVESVKAQLVYDEGLGGKALQLSSNYVGIDISLSGAVAEAVFGIDSGTTANSGSSANLGNARNYAAVIPEDLPVGTYTVVSSNGKAGSVTGSIDLAAAAAGGSITELKLSDLGVTDFSELLIDPDASGASGDISVKKSDGSELDGDSTVGDLIDAVNASMPDATAQLVEGSGGAVFLRISANEGGRDITINQVGASQGILKKVLGIDDTATSSNATTSSSDFTMTAIFYPRGSLDQTSRRVASGAESDYTNVGVSNLIDGVTIVGSPTGEVFTPGSARVQINNGSSLTISSSSKTQIFGVTGVTADSYATGLAFDKNGSGATGLNTAIKDLVTAGAFSLDGGEGVKAGTFRVGNSTLSLSQDEIDGGITISSVLARINSANEGISVAYEPGTDRFVVTSSAYGRQDAVTLGSYTGQSGTSNILKVLGLTNAPTQVSISAGADAATIDPDTELALAGFSITPTTGSFSINGIAIEVDTNADTLTDIIDKINASSAGVTASLDTVSNRLTLVQKVDKDTTAKNIKVSSASDTSNLLQVLRITGGATSDGSVASVESSKTQNIVGSDRKTAEVVVDNVHYSRNTNTIDDISPALTYKLQGETTSPITVTVSGDSEKALAAIANWVVEYNKTIKLLNPGTLQDSDKPNLKPVTDAERTSLTFNELVDRLDNFTQLNKDETIRHDGNFRILETQLRDGAFKTVKIPGSTLTSLADIGITSGSVGSPLTQDYQGVLVADSTDHDTILAALQSNQALLDALANDDSAVQKLFGQSASSSVAAKGTTAFDDTTPLANDITFQVYDGKATASITLPAGTSDKNDILNIITTQLSRAGLSGIKVSFDAGSHLVFASQTNTGRAYIRILDATGGAETDRLSSRFGLSGGSFLGEQASDRSGMAVELAQTLKNNSGINGFIGQKSTFGGIYGQGSIYDEIIKNLQDITDMEARIAQREDTLRAKFTAMENAISRLQQQQNALAQFIGSSTSASSSLSASSG